MLSPVNDEKNIEEKVAFATKCATVGCKCNDYSLGRRMAKMDINERIGRLLGRLHRGWKMRMAR